MSGPGFHKVDPTAKCQHPDRHSLLQSQPEGRASSWAAPSSRYQVMGAHTGIGDLKLQHLKAMCQHEGVSNSSKSHSRVILLMGFMKFLPLERKIETNALCIRTGSSTYRSSSRERGSAGGFKIQFS